MLNMCQPTGCTMATLFIMSVPWIGCVKGSSNELELPLYHQLVALFERIMQFDWGFCNLQVPSTVLKAKQVSVNIKRKHISASYIDEENQVVELVDSDLAWDVNVEESMWSLVPKDCIHVRA